MRAFFADGHPGGTVALCSKPDRMLTDGQAWKAFRTGVRGSRWHVLRGFHAFRHSFASNLAAAGVDQRVIDELMGHTTVDMQRRYRHLPRPAAGGNPERIRWLNPVGRPC